MTVKVISTRGRLNWPGDRPHTRRRMKKPIPLHLSKDVKRSKRLKKPATPLKASSKRKTGGKAKR